MDSMRLICKKGLVLLLCTLVLGLPPISAVADDYSFSSSILSLYPEEINQLSTGGAIAKPPITLNGEVLTDSSGKQVRFWGGVFRLSHELLKISPAEKARLVQNIKLAGFNQLRIVGIDFTDPGIYADWAGKKTFPKEKMQGLCEYTELMTQAGIFYSIDINHIAGKFVSNPGVKNDYADKNKIFKNSQLFDPSLIAEISKWYKAFLSEKHPGCSKPYSSDPYHFYINVVNEDSLFHAFFGNFEHLGKNNRKQLERLVKMKPGVSGLCSYQDALEKPQACSGSIQALYSIESRYYEEVSRAIRSTGYSGIISATNNWYGAFNRSINEAYGDVLNTHIYLSPSRRKSLAGKKFEAINDISVIENLGELQGWEQNHIYRLPASSRRGKPIVISEWNQSLWSDHVYEGAVLLLALALEYDVSVMTVHTLFDRRHGWSTARASTSYTVFGNPVLYALLPSLAKGFREELSQGNSSERPTYAGDVAGFEGKLRQGMSPLTNDEKSAFLQQFVVGGQEDSNKSNEAFIKDDVLVVDKSRFAAVAGQKASGVRIAARFDINFDSPGVITMVPMDGKGLATSKKILVTAVSDFSQGETSISAGLGKRYYKMVSSPGNETQKLKRHPVDIKLIEEGRTLDVRPLFQPGSGADRKALPVQTGAADTPWYILNVN